MKLSRPLGVTCTVLVLGGCALIPPEQSPLYPQMMDVETRLTRIERTIDNDGLVTLLSRIDALEKDVQDVFIKTLSFDKSHNLLIISDEKSRIFVLNLITKKVTLIK